MSNKDRVEQYYQCNVNNTQSNLNESCYKTKCVPSKEEYVKMLDEQIILKVRKKMINKQNDQEFVRQVVEREHEIGLIEREAKVHYFNEMKEDFRESNRNLAGMNRMKQEEIQKQELNDEIKQIKVILRGEKKLSMNERIKVNYEKEFLKKELSKQMKEKRSALIRNKMNWSFNV